MRMLLLALLCIITPSLKSQPYKPIEEGTILNLYDAFGKEYGLTKDFGFSCILKYQGKTILFDAGSNADIFEKNTELLNIDLKTVDIVIVSHAHFDHLNGLDHMLKVKPDVKVYFPYDFFWGAPVPFDATGTDEHIRDSLPTYQQYFDGAATKFTINQSGRFRGANIEFVKSSKEILPDMWLITTNSPFMGYFSGYPNKSFVEGQFQEQNNSHYKYTNLPELSLSLNTVKGDLLITGCSHSGVETIVAEAKRVTGHQISLLYGGFHLIPFDSEKVMEIVRTLKDDLQVKKVAPAHCTGHLAFKLLHDLYAEDYIFAGLGERIYFLEE